MNMKKLNLTRKFGSKKEFDQMVAIYKAHRKKGEIYVQTR